MSVNSGYSFAFELNVSHTKFGIIKLLLECKQYLIEEKKEELSELFRSCRKHF